SDSNKTIDSELGNFSTGQLKFLNLMRIMLKQYDWIILDEAFEGLDSRVRDFMILCIKDFQKQAKFIEISHSGFYVNKESRTINFEKINSQ
ncbi:multidrug ABC transporter ATP-binding protein, partial [Mycoplasmopsis pullorum]|uniref:ATP-binding cassette domain-containing protein n=1 Tax=Mycoplasmopsis pullorum TaxID=48003 RepID=UPI001C55E22D